MRYAITDGQYGMAVKRGSDPGLPGGRAESGAGMRGEPSLQLRIALLEQVARLAATGVEFIQVREKDLPAGELANLARQMLTAIRGSGAGTRLLINARADVAAATGADGVHLPPGDTLTPGQVRDLYELIGLPRPIVSRACHRLEEMAQAREQGPDLILFSPVFGKRVGEGEMAGVGIDLLRAACMAAGEIPVLALGGVTEENAGECLAAGAAGIAGIRRFRF
jgi:thiamine-phosphate pyrophosphorylase